MEIYIDILKAVAEGKRKPTHIMYRANLSWTRLRKYIDFLISQDLSPGENHGRRQRLRVDDEGKGRHRVLQAY